MGINKQDWLVTGLTIRSILRQNQPLRIDQNQLGKVQRQGTVYSRNEHTLEIFKQFWKSLCFEIANN